MAHGTWARSSEMAHGTQSRSPDMAHGKQAREPRHEDVWYRMGGRGASEDVSKFVGEDVSERVSGSVSV